MSTQTTEMLSQQVIELVSNQIGIPEKQISLDAQFVADLGFDSLDLVEKCNSETVHIPIQILTYLSKLENIVI